MKKIVLIALALAALVPIIGAGHATDVSYLSYGFYGPSYGYGYGSAGYGYAGYPVVYGGYPSYYYGGYAGYGAYGYPGVGMGYVSPISFAYYSYYSSDDYGYGYGGYPYGYAGYGSYSDYYYYSAPAQEQPVQSVTYIEAPRAWPPSVSQEVTIIQPGYETRVSTPPPATIVDKEEWYELD